MLGHTRTQDTDTQLRRLTNEELEQLAEVFDSLDGKGAPLDEDGEPNAIFRKTYPTYNNNPFGRMRQTIEDENLRSIDTDPVQYNATLAELIERGVECWQPVQEEDEVEDRASNYVSSEKFRKIITNLKNVSPETQLKFLELLRMTTWEGYWGNADQSYDLRAHNLREMAGKLSHAMMARG